MPKKTIAVLLSDGVNLRNFVYSDFYKLGKEKGWAITFINQTGFDLEALGLESVSLNGKPKSKTNLYKRARKAIELQNFERQFDDSIYQQYDFPTKTKSVKSFIKNNLVKFYERFYSGQDIKKLREKIKESERQSALYQASLKVLKELQPDIFFCTSQRAVTAIAPVLAAQDLEIPTATFIYSWDNLPKATLLVEPDHYLVWSAYMKDELLKYYPYIKTQQVQITGTPQFEYHSNPKILQTKKEFCKANNLDPNKDYICFSGDDVTTSPHDPIYLEDVAKAVKKLNEKGYSLGIIFRRCPVDFSNRYDAVLKTNVGLITPLAPIWNAEGSLWNSIIPQKEDQTLLANTVKHCKLVINLGSSMVFDAVCHDTPCAYINYNPSLEQLKKDVKQVYKYVHFRSMPSKDAVVWLNTPKDIAFKLKMALNDQESTLAPATDWFNTINRAPYDLASERIWSVLKQLDKN